MAAVWRDAVATLVWGNERQGVLCTDRPRRQGRVGGKEGRGQDGEKDKDVIGLGVWFVCGQPR